MKKLFIALCLVLAAALPLAGCAPKDKDSIKIVVPDGAAAIAAAGLMRGDIAVDGHRVEFEIVQGADALKTRVLNGEADLAVMPVNLASVIYNKQDSIRLMSTNGNCNLYLVSKEEYAGGLVGLAGKLVGGLAQGGTPDLVFRYLLKKAGFAEEDIATGDAAAEGKVTIRYFTAPSDLIGAMKAGKVSYGVFGEPQATQAANAVSGHLSLDFGALWKQYENSSESFPQTAFVVQKKFLQERPGLAEKVAEKLLASQSWIAENPGSIKEVLLANGSALNMDFSEALLQRCAVAMVKAESARADVEKYLSALKQMNAATVGGALPDDGFYHSW